MTWPLNGSEAGGDLVLIQTSLLLLCKSSCSYANYLSFTWEKQRGLYQSKVTSSLAWIHGQVTKLTTVKWPDNWNQKIQFHSTFLLRPSFSEPGKRIQHGIWQMLTEISYFNVIPGDWLQQALESSATIYVRFMKCGHYHVTEQLSLSFKSDSWTPQKNKEV